MVIIFDALTPLQYPPAGGVEQTSQLDTRYSPSPTRERAAVSGIIQPVYLPSLGIIPLFGNNRDRDRDRDRGGHIRPETSSSLTQDPTNITKGRGGERGRGRGTASRNSPPPQDTSATVRSVIRTDKWTGKCNFPLVNLLIVV
jgi:hypothetical protein